MIKKKYKCLNNIFLSLDSFSLITVQPEHIEKIRFWRNKQIEVLRQKKYISQKEQIEYFENHIWPSLGSEKPQNILLAYKKGEKLIGYGGLVHILWKEKSAESSFIIKNKIHANHSSYAMYMKIFFSLLKKLAFDDLKFTKITSETYRERKKHISILEEIGYKVVEPLNDSNSIFHELRVS